VRSNTSHSASTNANIATRLTHVFHHTHPNERDAVREGEQTFDRLNPEFGVPADQRNLSGRTAVRDRESALALGCGWPCMTAARTTATPVIWQPGQDYRMADAIHAARQPTRARWDPERVGPER
jgi:hypothetical protein